MKYAACALILNSDGTCVAVSRKTNSDDLGLPGGKLEPGENFLNAAIRETFEETGLTIYKAKHFFEREYNGFYVVTYLCKATGTISPKEEGLIRLVSPGYLIANQKDVPTTFSEYNIGVVCKLTMTDRIENWLNEKF